MASFLSRTNDRATATAARASARVGCRSRCSRAVRERVGADSRRLPLPRRRRDRGRQRASTTRWFGVALARAGLDFLSISQGGKFDDAKQPKVGVAVVPVHRAERLRVHADRASLATRAGRSAQLAARGASAPRCARRPRDAGGRRGRHRIVREAEARCARGDCDLVAAARQIARRSGLVVEVELGRGARSGAASTPTTTRAWTSSTSR
jgi:2,4-dienoyl-CoA reductase-like NADH-dependent reductase (Old Yellow Enzyme family)